MSEITGTTPVGEGQNFFPKPHVKSLGDLGLNAVLVQVMDDGKLCLAISVNDQEKKQRVLDVANEIMRHCIAPSP